MAISADGICDLGVSYPLAIEITRQMNVGTGNANLLIALGVPPWRLASWSLAMGARNRGL
jgi:hypothetical protein